MKKYIYDIILFISFFLFIDVVSANTLNNVDIDMVLDENGNAHVTEKWYMTLSESDDTEIYKKEYNLGNSTITNFSVSDENTLYTENKSWDIYGNFDSKKYKYGINTVSEGIELCWGISDYGSKTYTLEYDRNNIIFTTSDADVLYMKLISGMSMMNNMNYSIKISGPYTYPDTLDVWGYGAKGYAYVSNGSIFASNEENTQLNGESDYVVLLVKYPQGTFTLENSNSYSEYSVFQDVLDAANKDTFKYDYDTEEKSSWISDLIRLVITGLIIIFIGRAVTRGNYKFGPAGKKIDMKTIPAFRDIPCDKNIFKAYFLCKAYELNAKDSDFFGSLFLKWISEDKISIVKEDKKTLLGTKTTTSIDFTKFGKTDVEVENDIYKIIYTASKDGILDENEFDKYSKNNYSKILSWFDKAETYGRDLYQGNNLVTKEKSNFVIDDKLKESVIQLAGLKKYLIEFSQMDKKEAIEVMLWKDYLIYAQIFGIADKVANQFKKLYPEIVSTMTSSGYNIEDIILLNTFSTTAINAASSARSAANRYSSGGGGFSSGGGGGGSFGGGGGGSR